MEFPAYKLEKIPVTQAMIDAIGATPSEAYMGRDLLCMFDDEKTVRNLQPDMNKFLNLDEIISGHRRKAAAEKFGYRKVPVIIRVMSDDEAVINMVDSNLQRQQITFSEKAFAYKMKNEAMKRTGGRRKSSQSDYPLKGKKTVEIIGEEFGDSAKQVQRYLKLTDLIPELLEKLDNGELSFNPAVELSYLTIEEQKEFIDAMEYTQAVPSISQAQRMKKLSREKKLTGTKMREIMGEIKKGEITRVMFNNEQLYRYFPKSYTPAEMKEEILSMLNQWKPQKTAAK